MANRLKAMGTAGYENGFAVSLCPERLDEPLKRKKPTIYFVCSMGDLFHEDVPDEFIIGVHIMMNLCQHHTFIILTKRVERMVEFYEKTSCDDVYEHWSTFSGAPSELVDWPNLPNVHRGVTICNQEEQDRKVSALSQIPGKTFLSIEPMLGPIKFNRIYFNGVVDQVILGGESGKNARPMHPDWVRSVRDQCQAAGVPFMFKQLGEYVAADDGEVLLARDTGMMVSAYADMVCADLLQHEPDNHTFMKRIGKKKAGRTLDNKIHAELIWDKEEV